MIHYVVDIDDLNGLEDALGMARDKSKYVLRAAVNKAAKDVEKSMARAASRRYALNRGGQATYRKINKIEKATVGSLAAVITAKDSPHDLYDYTLNDRTYYPASHGAPDWVKAKALRRSRVKNLAARPGGGDQYKGFVVKFKSGHIAVAERIPGSRMRGKNKEAIRSLYSIAKSKSEEMVVREDLDEKIRETLLNNINNEIIRLLG